MRKKVKKIEPVGSVARIILQIGRSYPIVSARYSGWGCDQLQYRLRKRERKLYSANECERDRDI